MGVAVDDPDPAVPLSDCSLVPARERAVSSVGSLRSSKDQPAWPAPNRLPHVPAPFLVRVRGGTPALR